jgi:hypothetical protein
MTGTGKLLGRRRARLGGAMTAPPQTVRELVVMGGRVVLWLAIALVLTRGLASVAAPYSAPAPRATDELRVVGWPDDAARAFAIEFTTAYLTHGGTEHARELEAFAAPELVAVLAPRAERDGSRDTVTSVRSAAVAGTVRLDDRHALVTVAATLPGSEPALRLVTVPVARDTDGGLVVYDLPSFAPAAGRATVDPPEGAALLGSEREAIGDVLARFLRAYLAGDSAALAYLVPPGTRVRAAAGRWELIGVTSLSALSQAVAGERTVLATVQARDERLQMVYTLRYRVRLVRRDRWYVAEVNGSPRPER